MPKIGEKIIYGTEGVMTVVDVREVNVGDVSREYYVLTDPSSSSASETFVPVDSELVARMRPLLSRRELDEAFRLAAKIPQAEPSADSKARSRRYREVIESGDRSEMLAMIAEIRRASREREAGGKRIYLADENAMRRAERLITSELSAVLGISEGEAMALIEKKLAL